MTLDASEAGTYYVAGRCWGDYFEENVGSDNEPTADDDDALQTIGYDAWVVKITSFDIEDELDWSIQFGTVAYDTPTAIVAGASAVYVVGTISDDSEVLSEFVLSGTAPAVYQVPHLCVFRTAALIHTSSPE